MKGNLDVLTANKRGACPTSFPWWGRKSSSVNVKTAEVLAKVCGNERNF
jgi:hypothetical protein